METCACPNHNLQPNRDRIVQPFHAARAHADRGASLLEQATLTHFIREGHLARHVHRMCLQYTARQVHMVELLCRIMDEAITSASDDDGNAHYNI